MELEQALFKTPFENLNRNFRRSQKGVEKEISNVLKELNDIENRGNSLSKREAFDQLDQLSNKLKSLKRKLDEYKSDEDVQLQRFKARIDHLNRFGDVNFKEIDEARSKEWHKIRMDRILIDYLLRNEYYDTAELLAKESNISELVDIDVFKNAQKISDNLNQRECKEALKWCSENRSKLRKNNSNLEFSLRMQEFIELVRDDKSMEAIQHAQTHFTPLLSTNLDEIQTAMSALAFNQDTKDQRFSHLFGFQKWDDLVLQFRKEYYQLFGISDVCLLDLNLQSGLSTLKTHFCQEGNTNLDCPVCAPKLVKTLAEEIPPALHVHSKLICRITGKLMDDENPPLVMPNGNAYSRQAMQEMANTSEGRVIDPETGEEFQFSDLKRLYIC
eukprot:TRINITY_DN7822_c0_g1_i2.p1 TRINITY_DN7822_c0_g1~~TRINITY_DN7822_c0_g1_i2.p1  ORF type:complete len:387 (-),score=116.72 TRINITY_DN7822_c0_g1_i2:87-1247(-)